MMNATAQKKKRRFGEANRFVHKAPQEKEEDVGDPCTIATTTTTACTTSVPPQESTRPSSSPALETLLCSSGPPAQLEGGKERDGPLHAPPPPQATKRKSFGSSRAFTGTPTTASNATATSSGSPIKQQKKNITPTAKPRSFGFGSGVTSASDLDPPPGGLEKGQHGGEGDIDRLFQLGLQEMQNCSSDDEEDGSAGSPIAEVSRAGTSPANRGANQLTRTGSLKQSDSISPGNLKRTPSGSGLRAVRTLPTTPSEKANRRLFVDKGEARQGLDGDEEEDGDEVDAPLELTRRESSLAFDPPPFRVSSPELVEPEHVERYSDAVDQLQDIRCPVCIEPFNEPVTLPCNHNVCRSHIEDMRVFAQENVSPHSKNAMGTGFDVQCPKCRERCHFESSEAVQVNREMSTLVAVMLRMLKHSVVGSTPVAGGGAGVHLPIALARSSAAADDGSVRDDIVRNTPHCAEKDSEGEETTGARPTSAGKNKPALRDRSPTDAKRKKRTVGFVEPSETNEASAAPTSHGPRSSSPGAQQRNRLQELEAELEAQRKALREEKEKQQRAATAEFKRNLQAEQLRREKERFGIIDSDSDDDGTEVRRQPKRNNEPGEDTNPSSTRSPLSPTPPTGEGSAKGRGGKTSSSGRQQQSPPQPRLASPVETDEEAFVRKEREYLALRKEREEKKEKERLEKEAKLRSEIDSWIKSSETKTLSRKTDEISEQFAALEAYVEKLEKKSKDKTPPSPSSSQTYGSSSPRAPPSGNTFVDWEVESKLLRVERDFMRQADDEMSNAKKAEVAEERARAMLAAYAVRDASSKNKRPPPKPTYKTKLSRMQQF